MRTICQFELSKEKIFFEGDITFLHDIHNTINLEKVMEFYKMSEDEREKYIEEHLDLEETYYMRATIYRTDELEIGGTKVEEVKRHIEEDNGELSAVIKVDTNVPSPELLYILFLKIAQRSIEQNGDNVEEILEKIITGKMIGSREV